MFDRTCMRSLLVLGERLRRGAVSGHAGESKPKVGMGKTGVALFRKGAVCGAWERARGLNKCVALEE